MSINKTQPVNSSNGTIINRYPTLRDRLTSFLDQICLGLIEKGWENVDDVQNTGLQVIDVVAPAKKPVFHGWFFAIFGEDFKDGTTVSCENILHLTDGKFAITDSVLRRWADPMKGVPYGKGMTAVVKFNRRYMEEDGTLIPASYTLVSTAPATVEWEIARGKKNKNKKEETFDEALEREWNEDHNN